MPMDKAERDKIHIVTDDFKPRREETREPGKELKQPKTRR